MFLNYIYLYGENNKRTITNFLNTEYLNYAFSVLEECAIPSVIDGFKPGSCKSIKVYYF